jgi:hypothetical protein
VGIASGINRDHEKILLPGNSQTAVNQARLTPNMRVTVNTPTTSQNVLTRRPARTFSMRCCHISLVGYRDDKSTTERGTITKNAIEIVDIRQPSKIFL